MDAAVVHPGRQPRGLVATLEQRRAEVHVVEIERLARTDFDADALTVARLAGLPRQIELRVIANRMLAENDVAVLVMPEFPRRRHHPAHAQRGADLLGVARPGEPGADDFLERDDVRFDLREDAGDPLRPRPSIESPRSMDVIGDDAHIDPLAGHVGIIVRGAAASGRGRMEGGERWENCELNTKWRVRAVTRRSSSTRASAASSGTSSPRAPTNPNSGRGNASSRERRRDATRPSIRAVSPKKRAAMRCRSASKKRSSRRSTSR